MRTFNYSQEIQNLLTPEIVQLLTCIHEHKGRQDLFLEANTDELKTQDDKDATEIRKEGFRNIQVLDRDIEFQGVRLTKVEGTHGTEEMYANPAYSVLLGESMGVVFAAPGEKTTYLMGDTVWTARVDKTLQNRQPDILIMNTGYAKSICYNDSIIMGTEDVGRAATRMPKAKIVAVHMDAINHCTVSRKNMRDFVHCQGRVQFDPFGRLKVTQ